MGILDDYQLFLFDFDGLLVNTEHLHWRAYQELAAAYGYCLDDTFEAYCAAAHRDAAGPRLYLTGMFPGLKAYDWAELYEKKCEIYTSLLTKTELMPGVQQFLEALAAKGSTRAVVTHSRLEHIALIRAQHPVLQTIPHWITREDYTEPKPSPECYQVAIDRLAAPSDRIIGFEDTPRGLAALKGTRAQPVIVCAETYPLLPEVLGDDVIHMTSFVSKGL